MLGSATAASSGVSEPDDEAWTAALHALVEGVEAPSRPWRPLERRTQAEFDRPLPEAGCAPDELIRTLRQHGLLQSGFSHHEHFLGWVMGAGRREGRLGAVAAALTNVNAFGGAQAASVVEAQVLRWTAELLRLGARESVLVSGTSEANLLGLAAARQAALGPCAEGLPGPARVITSAAAHHSVPRASVLLGLGQPLLASEGDTLTPSALKQAFEAAAARAHRVVAVVATVGTPAAGAFDPIAELAEVCKRHGVWLHVDGAFGAWARLLDPDRAEGLEQADSIATDYHKALHAPYAAGALLARPGRLSAALASPSDYLLPFPGGFGGRRDWPGDRSLSTSRSFSALGIWTRMAGAGAVELRRDVARAYDNAAALRARLGAAGFEVEGAHGPVVVFRLPSELAPSDRDHTRIVTELQQRGEAVLTPVQRASGRALRACPMNPRTTAADLDHLVEALREKTWTRS